MQIKKIFTILWVPWMLVLPVLLIRGFTTIYPIFETFRISLYDINLLRGINEFVGLQNYVTMFKDYRVIASVKFTAIFVLSSMALHIVLGIILALLLNMNFKGRKLLRTSVLIPWAMPMVVIGIAARWSFDNDYGLVNDFIRWFVSDFRFPWLVYTNSSRIAVIAVDLWKNVPFFAILVLAGLQFIPEEIYDSARVDGAGPIQSFFKITLPLIRRNILILSIYFTMLRMISFDIVYAMTSGGPGQDTELIAYRIITEVFTNLNLGYGAALAVVLFFVLVLTTSIYLFMVKKIDY